MSIGHDFQGYATSANEEKLEIKNTFASLDIGVLKETSFQENRVSLTPNSVSILCEKGHKILVESQAGLKSGFSDNDYIKAGAIISSKENVIISDYLLKIEPPTLSEIKLMKSGQIIFSAVQLNTRNFEFFDLLEVFFATHDPTTLNRQANDVGTQYRSAIFYTDDKQFEIATRFIKSLEDAKIFENPIVSELKPLEVFYDAEDDHDSYYDLNRDQPYCTYLIDPKIKKLTTYFKTLLK